MRVWKKEKGLLSLEACIFVTVFLFVMLFAYSFFIVFEARNEFGHALLATTQSLSLDTYEHKNIAQTDNISSLIYRLYHLNPSTKTPFVTSVQWSRTLKGDETESGTIYASGLYTGYDWHEDLKSKTVIIRTNKTESKKDTSSTAVGAGAAEVAQDDKKNEGEQSGALAEDDETMSSGGGFRDTSYTSLGSAIEERFIAYLAGGDQTMAEKICKRYNVVNGLKGINFSKSYLTSSGDLHIVMEYKMEYEFNVFDLGKVSMRQSACSKIWK